MQRRNVHNFSNIRNFLIMKSKKKRSENFSRSEVYHLVDILEKYKLVIENKKLNAAAWADKKTAWENIAREFNESSGNPPRTWKTLKLKYEGIKKEIKRKYCLVKEHPSKVGNERIHTERLSSYEEKVLSMMQPRITGLQSDQDFEETSEQQPLMLRDCDESINYEYTDIKIEDLGEEQEEAAVSNVASEAIISAITENKTISQLPLSKENDEILRIFKTENLEEGEPAITNSIPQDDINVSVQSTSVNCTNLPQTRNRPSTYKKYFNRNASLGTSKTEDVQWQRLMALKRKVLLLQGTLLQDEIESRVQSRQLERTIMETNLETARVELKIKQKMLEQMG